MERFGCARPCQMLEGASMDSGARFVERGGAEAGSAPRMKMGERAAIARRGWSGALASSALREGDAVLAPRKRVVALGGPGRVTIVVGWRAAFRRVQRFFLPGRAGRAEGEYSSRMLTGKSNGGCRTNSADLGRSTDCERYFAARSPKSDEHAPRG